MHHTAEPTEVCDAAKTNYANSACVKLLRRTLYATAKRMWLWQRSAMSAADNLGFCDFGSHL